MKEYGIVDLLSQGDIVIRSVAIILLFMSIMSWTIALYKLILLARTSRRIKRTGLVEWSDSRGDTKALLEKLAAANLDRKTIEDCRELVAINIIEYREQSFSSGLPVLATISSSAPFIGLLGTVWGIYHAMLGLTVTELSSIAEVSGPIGETLIMTAMGLAVAIPALIFYNLLNRWKNSLTRILERTANEWLISGILPSGSVKG